MIRRPLTPGCQPSVRTITPFRTLSAPLRKYGDTESGHRWVPGQDAEGEVHWRCTSLRGRSPAPPGAARMSAYLWIGALSYFAADPGRDGERPDDR